MAIWSNSPNGKLSYGPSIAQGLRYSVNRINNTGIYIGPTLSYASPKNNRRGCLCLNEDRYGRDCCNGHLMEQGIGNINGTIETVVVVGAFSSGFSSGFATQI